MEIILCGVEAGSIFIPCYLQGIDCGTPTDSSPPVLQSLDETVTVNPPHCGSTSVGTEC